MIQSYWTSQETEAGRGGRSGQVICTGNRQTDPGHKAEANKRRYLDFFKRVGTIARVRKGVPRTKVVSESGECPVRAWRSGSPPSGRYPPILLGRHSALTLVSRSREPSLLVDIEIEKAFDSSEN